jgi:dipeptidyl aminopeptidase/acylaminoacyl peptidase
VVKSVSDIEMNGFQYAPDGKRILFVHDVRHEPSVQDLHQDLPQASGRVFDGLLYRHWKSWNNQKYSNIFYSDYKNGLLTGSPVNIMNEPFHSPLKPMGGMEQICWSPDSRSIAYTCRKLKGAEQAQSTNSDIYLYELASSRTTNLTSDLPGYDLEPVFSPDGRYLAWTSMERPGYEADRTRLMTLDLETRKRTELTEGWVYEANHPQWAADGQSLYFLSSKDFTYQLCQVQRKDRNIRILTEGQHDYSAFKLAGGSIVAARTSMAQPAEVYAVDPQNGVARQLSRATEDPWAGISKGKAERKTVRTKDGNSLNVWMIYPPDFNPAKKYPALLYCQGGPQSPLSQGFSYRWNFQLMAAKGYVVIAPCRRGMPGAGQSWCDAIRGDWGGGAMQDLLDATDYAAKEPYIDASRLGAVGASFGGYAVYWLAGNHNKRFKTFVSHCGLFNLESFYGATEEVWFPHYDFEGAYWQARKPNMYAKQSPHLFVQNWDTPILVIHNELDFRVPFGEGMQAFQAAQLRGIPSRFLSFPDEGHWMSKAQNSVLWQRVFFEWLDGHLKG